MIKEINKKKNLFYINVIKVLSAILIILCHYDIHSYYRNQQTILITRLTFFRVDIGDIGVSLFIIISGLTLALSFNNDNSIWKFYKKRFLAIFPSYWVSYIVVVIVFFMIGKTFTETNYWKFLLTVIGIDGLFLHKMAGFYLIGEWYLGFILTMYLVFPFLYSRLKKNPIQIFTILFLINIILHMQYNKYFLIKEHHNPLMRVLDFSFGILLTIYIEKRKKLKNILVLLAVFYLVFYRVMSEMLPYEYHMTFIGFALFLGLEYLIKISRLEKIKMLPKIVAYLSSLTFLSFLVHHQIILLFYEKIDDLEMFEYPKKFLIFLIIILMSFGYAISALPAVKYITKKLSIKLKI